MFHEMTNMAAHFFNFFPVRRMTCACKASGGGGCRSMGLTLPTNATPVSLFFTLTLGLGRGRLKDFLTGAVESSHYGEGGEGVCVGG